MKKYLIFILLISFLPLTGCTSMKKYEKEYFDVFDTYVSLTVYAKSEAEFLTYADLIHDELLRCHRLFDIYNDYEGINNLKTVNDKAGLYPVEVDPAIIDLVECAKQAYLDTAGTVNVAMGAVLKIWHEARSEALEHPEAAEIPSFDALWAASQHTDIDNVIINRADSTIFFEDLELSLDVGALAKGYAAQKAIERAKEAGLSSGLLNAGGNICVAGSPADGRDLWNVGIYSPEVSSEDGQGIADVVSVSDCAIVTSGNYERFYTVDGVRYHHIIDPGTLFPAQGYRSVSVIHSDSMTADILSTAAFILPIQQAKDLADRMGAEALWVTKDDKFYATVGYAALSQNLSISITVLD